jgi:hypothetical protein
MTTDTLIACSALGLSLYGVIAANRNNRLSVRPHLVAKRYFDWTDAGFVFSYDLSNHGFGPARLKKFILLLEGKPFSCPNTNLVEEFFDAQLKGKLEYQIPKFGHPNKDYCILPNQPYRVVEIQIPGATRADEKQLDELFKGMDLRIEYESFYGEKFFFDTRI